MHEKLQIIYEHGQPYGIRDSSGYLFFFRKVSKFPNQEERYRKEIQELYDLADYILEALKARANKVSHSDAASLFAPDDTTGAFDDSIIGSLP